MSDSRLQHVNTAVGDSYRVERELGVGGMATVYLARDLKHDRDVAIKVLDPELGAAVGAERFLAEIRTTARLQHPHILPLFDSGASGGLLYYVMPVVRGESLRERLDREKQLSVGEAVRITCEVAAALEHAHSEGIVHRDIKPENILLQRDGLAMVLDFGIGKALSSMGTSALTHTGMSVGTPAYMSPEQAVGEAVDGRSDIYSLACVLHELLVGEPPFTGPNAQAVIAKRFVQTPVDVALLREAVPRNVARALQRALQRTVSDRPASAAEFLTALRETAGSSAPSPDAAPTESIAVLPFASLSDDRENEYFGDGIAEDITNALAEIDGLHVAARMSAFSYKGKALDLRTIGEQLHVATVLQGSVRKAGNRIRIVVQLVAVADGYQLWSERYDRDLVDVFVVQDEIASAIANRLKLTFDKRPVTAPRATTAEVEVYELVVRGRALTLQRGRSILEAITCFERALRVDPDSVDALAGLGQALRVKAQYGLDSAEVCLPRAMATLERALALDPGHAEAMGYLATTLLNAGMPLDKANVLWERSLAIDPRNAEVRGLFGAWGLVIGGLGKDDVRGEAEIRRATSDDPRSAIVCTIGAIGFSLLGLHDEAIACAQRGRDADPGAFAPWYALSWTLWWAGRADEAFAEAERAIDQFGRHPFLLQVLTPLYMARGDRRRAEAIHAELSARAITTRVPWFSLAFSALALGQADEAMRHAIASAKVHDGLGPVWLRWPGVEPLMQHPQYEQLLETYRTHDSDWRNVKDAGSADVLQDVQRR